MNSQENQIPDAAESLMHRYKQEKFTGRQQQQSQRRGLVKRKKLHHRLNPIQIK